MVYTNLLLIATVCGTYVSANMAPNYPEPGTIWKAGKEYEISWFDDNSEPAISKAWKKFKIDFMTGDNNNQKFLKNVARDLDASKLKSLKWIAPDVEPHAAVYFLMFTNEKGENAWTTRFGITGEDGKLVKPEQSRQPDGAGIPWGVGRLVTAGATGTSGSPNFTYSMTPAMASAAEKNAAVIIAVSSNASDAHTTAVISFTTIILLMLATIFLA